MAMNRAPVRDERYVFETEWYDQQADIVRYYRLFFFPVDNSIEMYDIKMNRVFLKRIQMPNIGVADLFIGNRVAIYSRVLKIVNYGDVATANKQSEQRERTFAMIKPDAYQNIGKIVSAIQQAGFTISNMKMSKFTKETSEVFYGEHIGKPFFPNL